MKRTITSLAIVLAATFGSVQEIVAQAARPSSTSISPNLNYDQLKAAGALGSYTNDQLNTLMHQQATTSLTKHGVLNTIHVSQAPPVPVVSSTSCNCWVDVDSSFDIVPFTNGTAPEYRNDDGSSPVVTLPFNFCFYGTTETSVYINNNGNISFGTAFGAFTSVAFPSTQYTMIAPFWADVDTRALTPGGVVHYKLTPTYLIVQWDSVGYYSMSTDKLNTFQLIISNGIDPIIPGGNNVSFCYKDMQWTTGAASGGTDGFGGNPATVGANSGDGVAFIQIGQFDSAGTAYDGPFGANDEVSWLDNQTFSFNSCTSTNIQPIVSGLGFCDTITVCSGDSVFPSVSFLSPESTQLTTATATSTLSNFSITNSTSGNSATITAGGVPTIAEAGYQTITFSGTDDGTPALTTNVTVVIHVLAGPTANLDPSGTITICGGNSVTLNANAGDYHYTWYLNGVVVQDGTISSYLANSPGVYTVSVADNTSGCATLSPPTTAIVGGGPIATISVPTGCGAMLFNGGSTTLTVTAPGAASYLWSPGGQTTATITVTQAGTYCVTAYDASGCPSDVPACTTVNTASVACGHNGQKVVLCHVPPGNPGNPQTLCIAPSAVPAHLANHPGDCLGSCDLYFPRLSSGEPVEILDFLAEAYPNPFNSGFTVHVISSEETPIAVYIHDITGRIVETHSDVSYNTMIGSNLAPGMYSAEVVQGDNRQMINILKADR